MEFDSQIIENRDRRIGRRVYHLASVSSTNDYGLMLADRLSAHGYVVLADAQTAGRGQYGRTWAAAPGSSVLMSIILQPTDPGLPVVPLTAWASLAVLRVVHSTVGRKPRLKWPNDVLIDTKKTCGILIEKRNAIVVGIGLNVNQTEDQFLAAGLPSATSMALAAGRPFDTQQVADALVSELDQTYDRLLGGNAESLESSWSDALGLIGCDVLAECHDGTRIRGRLETAGFANLVVDAANRGRLMLVPEQVRSLTAAT